MIYNGLPTNSTTRSALSIYSFGDIQIKANEDVGKFCFSQWFELPFVVDGVTYRSTEHWMMANKALLFEDQKTYNKIIAASSPAGAKKLGIEVQNFDEQLWLAYRYEIVVNGNIHKFNQNPKFAEYLLNTHERVLVEASPMDKIWGIGMAQNEDGIDNPYFWNGLNLLGFALMEARDFLVKYGHFEAQAVDVIPPWKAFPSIHPYDAFWRMGGGESCVIAFAELYDQLNEREQVIFRLNNPPPFVWQHFYEP